MIATVESLRNQISYNKKNKIDPTAHYASVCRNSSYAPIRANFCPGRNCSHHDEKYRIAVRIGSNIPTAWRQATINAMNQWNNLPNNRIYFYTYNKTCDIREWDGITVGLYSESDETVAARANLPSQRPGRLVKINTNYWRYSTSNTPVFTRVMIHEFGHAIGYRHTDQTNGCYINGSTTTDSESIMNSQLNAGLAGNGFSNSDKTAHNLLYPNANSSARIVEFKCRLDIPSGNPRGR